MKSHAVRHLIITTAVLLLAAPFAAVRAQYSQAQTKSDPYSPAREWSDDIPAHLAFVDGSVTLEREGRLEPAEANLALLAGDRVKTRAGRVEVMFADGSALSLDEDTELDFLSDSLVRLLAGRMALSISRATSELDYRIDAPAASVWIRGAGEYRIDVRQSRQGQPEVDLAVIRGSAELVNEHGRTLVRAGTHAVATPDLAPSLPYVVNSASWDEFDRWLDRQRAARVGTYSTRYLPTELRYYSGAFDAYGNWDYVPDHGYVWYPRVSTGWRPYSQGRWSFTAHFGWSWVGIDRWSWPTHHYGRWGHHAGGWYWIPDRRWAPAWVSWGSAPGYVSWCPLGYDGRAVYGFRNTNYWSAWTIVPAQVFVPNIWVTRHIVVHDAISPAIQTQFVERPVAPIIPRMAQARTIEPIRAPTFSRGTAVPRGSRPAYDGEEAWRRTTTGSAMPRSSTTGSSTSATGLATRGDGRIAQPETTVQRATPSRLRTAPSVTGPEAPRATAPRADVPRADAPVFGDRRAAPRAQPEARPDDERPVSLGTAPQRSSRPSAPPSTSSNDRAYPRSGVRVIEPSSRPSPEPQQVDPDRGRSRVPSPERVAPSRPSPPPQRSEPDRGPSRVPDRAAPTRSAPPPSAAPPPSGGRGSESRPSSLPSRGGGGGDSRAVPRARGGGGV